MTDKIDVLDSPEPLTDEQLMAAESGLVEIEAGEAEEGVEGVEGAEESVEEAGGVVEEAAAPATPSLEELQAKVDQLSRERDGILSDLRTERKVSQALHSTLEAIDSPAQEEEVPDKEYDPAGYAAYQAERAAKTAEETAEVAKAREVRENNLRVIQSIAADFEAEKAKPDSDFQAVEDYLLAHYRRIGEAEGLSGDNLEVALRNRGLAMSVQALKLGQRPADYARRYATHLGYKPSSNGGEGKEAKTETGAEAEAGSSEIADTARKLEQSKTVTQASGRPGRIKMNDLRARIKQADEAEYAEIRNELVKQLGSEAAADAWEERNVEV